MSTGGWIEHVIRQGPSSIRRYVRECAELGFDMIEISSGFISMPPEDMAAMVKEVKKVDMHLYLLFAQS